MVSNTFLPLFFFLKMFVFLFQFIAAATKTFCFAETVEECEADTTYLVAENFSAWEDYLGKLWLKKGYLTTVHSYTTVKDLKVMSTTKQGELYTEMLMDKEFKKMAYKDLKTYYKVMPQVKKTKDPSEMASRLVSASAGLESGQKFINEALNRGYDALFDSHGTNVADNPIIVLNADKNLKEIDKPQYTEAAKNYLKELYEIAV